MTTFGQRFEQGFVKALRQTRDLFSRLKTMAVKLSFHCQNKSFYSQYDFDGVHGGRSLGLREPVFGGTVQ